MNFEYVIDHYKVPACYGRRVTVGGKPGIIIADRGHYIGVNFDDAKPGRISNCHPTHEVEYGDIGKARKMTRSQRRWAEYNEVAECFQDFAHWLRYKKMQKEKEEAAF